MLSYLGNAVVAENARAMEYLQQRLKLPLGMSPQLLKSVAAEARASGNHGLVKALHGAYLKFEIMRRGTMQYTGCLAMINDDSFSNILSFAGLGLSAPDLRASHSPDPGRPSLTWEEIDEEDYLFNRLSRGLDWDGDVDMGDTETDEATRTPPPEPASLTRRVI